MSTASCNVISPASISQMFPPTNISWLAILHPKQEGMQVFPFFQQSGSLLCLQELEMRKRTGGTSFGFDGSAVFPK